MLRLRRTIPAVLCLMLTIPGCGLLPAEAPPVALGEATIEQAVELACPPVAAADRAEARRAVPKPAPDTTNPMTGKPAVSAEAVQRYGDEQALAIVRKNGVIDRQIAHIERCGGKAKEERVARAEAPELKARR